MLENGEELDRLFQEQINSDTTLEHIIDKIRKNLTEMGYNDLFEIKDKHKETKEFLSAEKYFDKFIQENDLFKNILYSPKLKGEHEGIKNCIITIKNLIKAKSQSVNEEDLFEKIKDELSQILNKYIPEKLSINEEMQNRSKAKDLEKKLKTKLDNITFETNIDNINKQKIELKKTKNEIKLMINTLPILKENKIIIENLDNLINRIEKIEIYYENNTNSLTA
jgi:hypothetical protein